MTVRELEQSSTLTDFSIRFQLLLAYREPMEVQESSICYRVSQSNQLLRIKETLGSRQLTWTG